MSTDGGEPEHALKPEPNAPMRALNFMVGEWELDYTVTQHGCTTKPLRGTGSFRYIHEGVYLAFDYRMQQAETGDAAGEAHAIFAWDAKAGVYRFFWFESSGNFQQATGVLRDDGALALEWQDLNCTQTFQSAGGAGLCLEMRCPADDLLLRVDFTRLDASSAGAR